MKKLACEYGCIVVGRKTYEANQSWPVAQSLRGLTEVKKVVVSSKPRYDVAQGFVLAPTPDAAINKLKDYDRVLLIGGGELNAAFAARNLIDELVLNVEAVVIGKGKPVFGNTDFDLKLELLSFELLTPGILQVQYKVLGNSQKK